MKMRHFWFTDHEGENVIADHRGNIRGAIAKAMDYLKHHSECEYIQINEDEDIIETVHIWG